MSTNTATADQELLPLNDHRAGAIAILEHYLDRLREGDVVGLMVIAERADGGVELKQSSTVDVYGRLGRLDAMHRRVLKEAKPR